MVARENFQEILRHLRHVWYRIKNEIATNLFSFFFFFFLYQWYFHRWNLKKKKFYADNMVIKNQSFWWSLMNESTHESLSSSTLFIIMIVNRKDDIDPSDIRFERMDPSITWKRVLYIYRLFCRSWTLSELSSRGIEDGWPVIDDEAWLVAAEIEGVFIETPFLGRGCTGWIFIHGFLISRIGDKIVSPSITDNTSLSLLSYKLLFIINIPPIIEFYTFYLQNRIVKQLLLSSYKLSFIITILIPNDVKNTNYINILPIKASQNWNPPNFFCCFFNDTSHKPLVDHSFIRDLSRKIRASRFHVYLDHVSSPRAGNSVSGGRDVRRTTKLFYATRSANSTIGSAPDPVFFALTNFACREAC